MPLVGLVSPILKFIIKFTFGLSTKKQGHTLKLSNNNLWDEIRCRSSSPASKKSLMTPE